MVEVNPAIPSTPILDFVRKSTQKERKRYRAPRSFPLQCFAFETLPSTVLMLIFFYDLVNTFFYSLWDILQHIIEKTEKTIAITIIKIFLYLFFAHTTYYTSNTIFCRTIFLKTVQVVRYLQTICFNGSNNRWPPSPHQKFMLDLTPHQVSLSYPSKVLA